MKIALMAYARSGKDEIYSIIKGMTSSEVGRLAFGDALRKYAHKIVDVPLDPKPRWLYEQFGKAMRDIDENVWVKQLEKTYQEELYPHYVITDLRQPNEYEWAKENGFIIVKVVCDETTRKERSQGDTNWVAVNPSETEIANLIPDMWIWNNGNLDDLKIAVKNLVKEIESTWIEES